MHPPLSMIKRSLVVTVMHPLKSCGLLHILSSLVRSLQRLFTEGGKIILSLSTPWDKVGLTSPERESIKNLALCSKNVLGTTPYFISLFLSFISQASVFMGFSITSSVLSLIIISFYSLAIAVYRDYYGRGYYKERHYDEDMALCVIILILSIVEFAIGIWASVCICLINPCPCCNTSQQQVSLWKVINQEIIDNT